MQEAAKAVQFDAWALHADHITIKKGDAAEIEGTKQLIDAQIAAGYTSFAIDASHLFNFEGKTVREELKENIQVTSDLALYINNKMKGKEFGLEVEVGEIGRKDGEGLILTKPEEAVGFIKALNENGVHPHVLAIANGSTHGHTYDANGNVVEQLSIDIPRTKEIAKALRENNLKVGIAQHGITGTPRDLINQYFPKGDIIKGNVGTFWQDVVFSTLKVYEPRYTGTSRNGRWRSTVQQIPERKTGRSLTATASLQSRNFIKRSIRSRKILNMRYRRWRTRKAWSFSKRSARRGLRPLSGNTPDYQTPQSFCISGRFLTVNFYVQDNCIRHQSGCWELSGALPRPPRAS